MEFDADTSLSLALIATTFFIGPPGETDDIPAD